MKERGVDMDCIPYKQAPTALMYAVQLEKVYIVKWMLKAGCKINIKADIPCPMDYDFLYPKNKTEPGQGKKGKIKCNGKMKEKDDIQVKESQGVANTEYDSDCDSDEEDWWDPDDKPLQDADTCHYIRDDFPRTVTPLWLAISKGNEQICKLLISNGAEDENHCLIETLGTDCGDEDHRLLADTGPLFLEAAAKGQPSIVKLLVNKFEDLTRYTGSGASVLSFLVRHHQACDNIIITKINGRKFRNLKDDEKREVGRLFVYADKVESSFKYLISEGCDVDDPGVKPKPWCANQIYGEPLFQCVGNPYQTMNENLFNHLIEAKAEVCFDVSKHLSATQYTESSLLLHTCAKFNQSKLEHYVDTLIKNGATHDEWLPEELGDEHFLIETDQVIKVC